MITTSRSRAVTRETSSPLLLARKLDELRAQQATPAQSITGKVGEAKQPGIIGFLIGLAAGAFINYKCEQQQVGWKECTAAGVPVALVCAVIPF